MISAPTMMYCRCSTVADCSGRPIAGDERAQHDRQDEDQRGAEERAGEAAEPADDDHEQDEEALVDVEHGGFRAAVPEEHQHRAGDAAVERRDREGEQLGRQQPDADQLGRDVHVAHRHPHAPDAAVHEVRREPRHRDDDRQHDEIARERRSRSRR